MPLLGPWAELVNKVLVSCNCMFKFSGRLQEYNEIVHLYLQECISPKPNNKNLGNDSRSHALKRLFDDDLEQLPSQKSFKRHKSFDVSREKVSQNDLIY